MKAAVAYGVLVIRHRGAYLHCPEKDRAGVAMPATFLPVRGLVWALHLAMPLLGLWLLLARPVLDVRWQHNISHFWLVLVVAAVNVALGAAMSFGARQRGDARLF